MCIGWRSLGVDSGIISNELLKSTMNILYNEYNNNNVDYINRYVNQPYYLLKESYNNIIDNTLVTAGSTTVCLLSLVPDHHHLCPKTYTIRSPYKVPIYSNDDDDDDNDKFDIDDEDIKAGKVVATKDVYDDTCDKIYLHTCNLGDSGFCVIRNNRVIFHSSPQRDQHHVHQLSVIPAKLKIQQAETNEDEEYADDKPEDSLKACCELHENDVIILATDGLW